MFVTQPFNPRLERTNVVASLHRCPYPAIELLNLTL